MDPAVVQLWVDLHSRVMHTPPSTTDGTGLPGALGSPRLCALIGLALIASCLLTWSIDAPVHEWAKGVSLGGDVRRTMETVQQFGDAATVTLSCILILLLDPARRRRVLDIVITVLAVAACTYLLKMTFGRPRPVLEDPAFLSGPLGTYPLAVGDGFELRSPWHFWIKGTSNLWSFPSSHTSGAMALGLSLWWFYPRLKWLMVALIVVVGVSRVVLKAHYLSDVLAGAGVALLVAPMTLNWLRVRAARRTHPHAILPGASVAE